jgi:uncharacterized membrane protein HdeD (DUF308 family)
MKESSHDKGGPMVGMFRSEWWIVVARGALAVIFGVIVLARPFAAVTAVIMFIGLFILLDGVLSIVTAVRGRPLRWGLGLFEGLLGLLIGVLALAVPGVTAVVLAVMIGAWAFVTGILELIAARILSRIGVGAFLGIAGWLSVLLGLAVVFFPRAGVVVLSVILGLYALLYGTSLIAFGLRVRRLTSEQGPR